MASWAQSCPVPSLPYQQGTDTHLDSDWTCISLDDNICVTSRLGVTVLSTLITLKFIHIKFQQKYKWHLPSYKIWDATKIWSMRNKKKRNRPMNSSGLRVWDKQLNPQLFKCKFLFLVSFCTILYNLKLVMMVHANVLYPFIFLDKSLMHKFSYK